MSRQANRLEWVDTAKGISILLVVMMYAVFNVGQDAEGVGALHYVIGFATPFRMPEFFLISGLFLSQVIGRQFRAYADRRVVHYLYFYALWAVIHIVVKIGIASRDPGTALEYLAWAVVEPYGVLWFIYLLAAFSLVTKLAYDFKAPAWAVFGAGAVLQMASIHTGSYLVDQFCSYFVYFYAGYVFAPQLFRLVAEAQANTAVAAVGLVAYAAINASLVFSPGFAILPEHVQMGLAALPGVHLLLALAGSAALCVFAGLISGFRSVGWLRWLGEHSIVVYLVFVLPMSFTRIALGKIGLIQDVTTLSVIVMVVSVLASVALYFAVKWTGWGKFLFERPSWAHLPGTKGSRGYKAAQVPAE